ncbi:asparagine synthase-related protein [Candidatus Saccharibacteria bacterium]|nr:asparagine synthase-related protein [Candidatus Saccharibacteria bacterium]
MVNLDIESIKKNIRRVVGDKKVLCYVSGGVDSTVLAKLLYETLSPEQIIAVHINHGFMRAGESHDVQKALDSAGMNLRVVHAVDRFLNATTTVDGRETPPLKKVTDPQIKRQIIGDTFMRIQQLIEQELDIDLSNTILAQGTIAPDIIETKAGVKTHHNDSPAVHELRKRGEVLEPFSEFYKPDVRKLGELLGLPKEIVHRQPFPGPGLAIRLICAEEPFLENFDETNSALKMRFENNDVFANLLPIKTVGVKDNKRSYSYAAVLSGQPNWRILFKLAQEIPKSINNINRVVYIFGEKINHVDREITPTLLSKENLSQLRAADKVVNDILTKYDLTRTISQVPVISFPVPFGQIGNRSICIRPFITKDFMTGRPVVPGEDMPEAALDEMVNKIVAEVPGISRVVLDLTPKPPGTTEWE